MNLFGIEVKHPSPRGLGLATLIILTFLAINLLLSAINDSSIDKLFPSLAAVSAGAISASFGISPAKGWRACLMLFVIATISFTVVQVLTGQALTN
ncbi:hypothetical protein [Kangiella sp.]|uniref:hypothetical protein n=1 Tax=Kangiella sp. TaxID=1920245 RepID=UPI003A8E3726